VEDDTAVPVSVVVPADRGVTGKGVPADDDVASDVAPAFSDDDAADDVVPNMEVVTANGDATDGVGPADEIAAGNVAPLSEDAIKDVTTADVGADDDNVPNTVSAARIVVASGGPDGSV